MGQSNRSYLHAERMLLLIWVTLILNAKLIEGENRYFLAELEDTESNERRKELKDATGPNNVTEEAASEKSSKNIGPASVKRREKARKKKERIKPPKKGTIHRQASKATKRTDYEDWATTDDYGDWAPPPPPPPPPPPTTWVPPPPPYIP